MNNEENDWFTLNNYIWKRRDFNKEYLKAFKLSDKGKI